MFEHFAKKNSGIYFSKNAKEKSKKLIFPKYKKSKNMFFSFFLELVHEKLMYFLGLKVTLD